MQLSCTHANMRQHIGRLDDRMADQQRRQLACQLTTNQCQNQKTRVYTTQSRLINRIQKVKIQLHSVHAVRQIYLLRPSKDICCHRIRHLRRTAGVQSANASSRCIKQTMRRAMAAGSPHGFHVHKTKNGIRRGHKTRIDLRPYGSTPERSWHRVLKHIWMN